MQRLVLSSFLAVPHFLSLVLLHGVFYCYQSLSDDFFGCTLCADVFTEVPYFLLYCQSDLQESSSPILCGRYSLSMLLCGCRVRWAVMSFLVLRSRSSTSAIVQSTMPAVYLITGTAQLLIAWIVFPPFSLDFSILRTLLVYSADVCFFT